jgi:hypothetical protein
MRRALAMLSLVLVSGTAHALEIDPFKGPKPIAVLVQTDPWLMVIGSDTPMVAIYENGQVVYLKKEKDKSPSYFAKQLSAEALAEVKKKLTTFGDYSKLKRYYDLAPHVTDLPETNIYLSLGRTKFVTGVYGLMTSDTHLPAYTTFPKKRKPDELPKTIKELHAYLTSLDFADAKPWEPPYVEVMVWGYEYAPEESIHWPKNWPGLDSPNTLKRGDAYSMFLAGKELPMVREFLKAQRDKGAVEIGGKKWAVSTRYTFPSEPVWFEAFRGEAKEPDEPSEVTDSDKTGGTPRGPKGPAGATGRSARAWLRFGRAARPARSVVGRSMGSAERQLAGLSYRCPLTPTLSREGRGRFLVGRSSGRCGASYGRASRKGGSHGRRPIWSKGIFWKPGSWV